ncbi:hypothetical protein EC845_2529 [Comamonas sp. BIGb0124]|nr:hypothetical protein EC845_2529 [Comamonas sp. BIGb0124]
MCAQGRSLLVPSGPRIEDGQKHLFAILINPVAVDGRGPRPQVFMTSVCSIHEGIPYDDACVLDVGEHPFVRHRSYIDYSKSDLYPANDVELKVQQGLYTPHDDFSIALLRRIVACAEDSRRIRKELKRFLRDLDLPR